MVCGNRLGRQERYEVCVLDRQAHVVARKSIEHSGTGIAEFVDWLVKWCAGKPERIAISIETPRGAMVESLVERTFAVFAINPKQLDRFRDRYTVAGAKDDSRDAFVLGGCIADRRTLGFHRVGLEEAAILRMRGVVAAGRKPTGRKQSVGATSCGSSCIATIRRCWL